MTLFDDLLQKTSQRFRARAEMGITPAGNHDAYLIYIIFFS